MEAGQHDAVSAGELAERFAAIVVGNPQARITRFASLVSARSGEASFLSHPRYRDQLMATQASVVVVTDAAALQSLGLSCTFIQADDPYLFFAKAASLLIQRDRVATVPKTAVHASAVVDGSAVLGQRVRVGPGAVLAAGVRIGDDTDIDAGCIVGEGSQIGAGSHLHARVTIGSGCHIGSRAVIHSGVVIGSDGFGLVSLPDRSWLKVPQSGSVKIGNDVEIGANTTIDRGTLDATIIEDGVKLDNLIQIAHNVRIGCHTAVAACVGIAGSARVGAYCQIGGAAGILGHLEIPDFTIIGPMTLVMSSIERAGKYVGVYPLQEQRDWEKSAVLVRRLPRLRKQLKQIDGQDS
jgi:UDP-3-O-[3-hydroxymyristoyl] glucosamine N-acyltransferase